MDLRIALFALIFCYEGTKSQSPATVCNGVVAINCQNKLIAISSATFEEVNSCSAGMQTSVNPPCNSSTAVNVVKTACEYKEYCRLGAADVTFETTCSGNMLLSVSYTCVYGLQGDRYLHPLKVTKSSVQLGWQKHYNEDDNTEYVIERRYVPLSQPSAIAGLSFEGFGYIKFASDPFDGGKKFITKLSFRTSALNGLLFVAFRSGWSSYAYLQLTNGKLKFAVKDDKGSVDVSAAVTLNDGQFHTVEAEKRETNSETLRLIVDGTKVSADDSNGDEIDVSVDTVYVGGLATGQWVKAGVLSQTDGFIGCMNVEQLDNSRSFDLLRKQGHMNVRWSSDGCPPAVQAGMHFRGAGYAQLTLSSSLSSRLQFGFRMRTSWPNGLLVAAYSSDRSDFLFVETSIDGLDLRYRKGFGVADGPFLFRVRPRSVSLCDGAWHTVSLEINTTAIDVTVDGIAESTSSKIADIQTYSSEIMENFYLGGMEHKGNSPTMAEVALGFGVNMTGYGGCLADFEINGQLVDYAAKRSDSLNVSFTGCSDFTWAGPVCVDQALYIGSKGKGKESLTDSNGVKAFTEYLYRLSVKSGSDALVRGPWIVVRAGEDYSSKGPLPELEYDGALGKGTFRWTGPPTIVKDDTSYEIEFAEVYPGTTVQPSAFTFKDIKSVSLPRVSDVAALTMYTFKFTASLTKGSITSDYATVTTNGRECRRALYRGSSYRGSAAVSADGKSCLNWSELSTYTNLLALYPEAGLGNHSYCRNPISENRTMPWCYTEIFGACLNWTYCDIDKCEDVTCYSTVDNGYGYRGSIADKDCVSWKQFNTFSVSQYAAAGLGDHSYCRNPDPQMRSKPWCYEDDGDIKDCSVSKCINDGLPSVTYVCGGNLGSIETE